MGAARRPPFDDPELEPDLEPDGALDEFDDEDDDGEDEELLFAPEEAAILDTDGGRIVFRAPHDRSERFVAWGMAAGFALGLAAIAETHELYWLPLFVVLGFVVSFILERRTRRYQCSNRECEALLAEDLASCPGCGRPIAGTIRKLDDRLAADEEWEDRTRDRVAEPPPQWYVPNPFMGPVVPRSTDPR